MGLIKTILQKLNIIESEDDVPVKDPRARPEEKKRADKKEKAARKTPRAEKAQKEEPEQKEDKPQKPEKAVQKKVISLEELRNKSKKLKLGIFDELIKPGEELKLTFDEIFERANVQEPKHGWNIRKITDRLETKEFALMNEEQIKAALAGEIKADKATPKDVLQDAVSRDEVLDDFEKFLARRIARNTDALLDENAAIEAKLRELTEKKAQNTKRMENEKKALAQWKLDKVALEQKMAKASLYLTSESVVSVGLVSGNEPEQAQKAGAPPVSTVQPGSEKKLEQPQGREKIAQPAESPATPFVSTPSDEEVPQLIDTSDFKF